MNSQSHQSELKYRETQLGENIEKELEEAIKKMNEDGRLKNLQNIKKLPIKMEGKVLELGAGSCWFSAELSKLKEIEMIYAIDFSKNLLARIAPRIMGRLKANQNKIMRIGKNRIAVIIGKNGETKKDIEESLGVQINLDSKTGDCEFKPIIEHPNYTPLNTFTAQKVVNAINRGFNPVKAMKLLDETFDMEVFNLYDLLGKSEKKIKRLKGRIIGRNGEMRKAIERFAESYVSVYGKTVSIIADYDNLQVARKAVNMLLSGMPHHSVLKFLENKYNEKKKEEFRKMYKPEF